VSEDRLAIWRPCVKHLRRRGWGDERIRERLEAAGLTEAERTQLLGQATSRAAAPPSAADAGAGAHAGPAVSQAWVRQGSAFVQELRAQGWDDEQIAGQLRVAGWAEAEIAAVLEPPEPHSAAADEQEAARERQADEHAALREERLRTGRAYIRPLLEQGRTAAEIAEHLRASGWAEEDVAALLESPPAPPSEPPDVRAIAQAPPPPETSTSAPSAAQWLPAEAGGPSPEIRIGLPVLSVLFGLIALLVVVWYLPGRPVCAFVALVLIGVFVLGHLIGEGQEWARTSMLALMGAIGATGVVWWLTASRWHAIPFTMAAVAASYIVLLLTSRVRAHCNR